MNATHTSTDLPRRAFIGAGAVGAGMVLTGVGPAQAGTTVSTQPAAGGTGTTVRNPLYLPPALTTAALTAAPATVNFGSSTSPVLAYNGSLPGPTVRARRGDSVSIAFTNRLTEQTTIHWHGMVVPTAADRLRVLNGANGRVFRLALSSGAAFTLIGNDGGLLERSASLGSIEFGNGERLDLLVDFRSVPVGDHEVDQSGPDPRLHLRRHEQDQRQGLLAQPDRLPGALRAGGEVALHYRW